MYVHMSIASHQRWNVRNVLNEVQEESAKLIEYEWVDKNIDII